MPQVRKQQYTKPIPPDATQTTMKVRRRGGDSTVPAVRFRGEDGRAGQEGQLFRDYQP